MTDVDPYEGSTDDEGGSPKISPRVSSIDSDGGGDTEDEIRRWRKLMRFLSTLLFTYYRIKAHQNMEEDPYGGSTEEEDDDKEGVQLFPDFVHVCGIP